MRLRLPACLAFSLCAITLAQAQSAGPGFYAKDTIVIGDSITAGWNDFPNRTGFYGMQACVIRLNLGTFLAAHPRAKRLLIEAGTNDIIDGPSSGFDCQLPNQRPQTTILDMVKTAKTFGLDVYVMSVLPISWNNRAGQPCDPLIPPFNASLQTAITSAGATWVDGYDAFNGHPEYQIDGVHPNETGYHVLETVFATTVCTAHECGASATSTSITLSPSTVTQPASGTMTVVVSPAMGEAIPTGVVEFVFENDVFATAALDKTGKASVTLPTSNVAPGSYTISAIYTGDAAHIMSWSQFVTGTVK